MNLSHRLSKISKEIKKGEAMADIGTDHGFLPIYLIKNNISPKAIMCDISSDSLSKAIENCKLYDKNYPWDWRVGDGLQVIENGEVESLVIAGMGGILMTEILGEDLNKTKSFKKIILQPRSNAGFLRKWIKENGFTEINVGLAEERNKFWEIITIIPEKPIHLEIPLDILREKDSHLVKKYLREKGNKYKFILSKLDNNFKHKNKLQSCEEALEWIDYLEKRYFAEEEVINEQ